MQLRQLLAIVQGSKLSRKVYLQNSLNDWEKRNKSFYQRIRKLKVAVMMNSLVGTYHSLGSVCSSYPLPC